jgi:hypothetical protein
MQLDIGFASIAKSGMLEQSETKEREVAQGHDIGLVLFDVGGVLIDLYSKEAEAVLEREYGLDPASYERIAKPAMECCSAMDNLCYMTLSARSVSF